VLDRNATARTERQAIQMFVLLEIVRNAIVIDIGRRRRCADGKAADLLSSRQVSLDQRRRHLQYTGYIVEAITAIIWRQERAHVHVEVKEITNHVLIFGAVQAMEGLSPARIRMRGRTTIKFLFDGTDERVMSGLVRARPASRRHQTSSQLPNNL